MRVEEGVLQWEVTLLVRRDAQRPTEVANRGKNAVLLCGCALDSRVDGRRLFI